MLKENIGINHYYIIINLRLSHKVVKSITNIKIIILCQYSTIFNYIHIVWFKSKNEYIQMLFRYQCNTFYISILSIFYTNTSMSK